MLSELFELGTFDFGTPEWKVVAYPASAIPQRRIEPFVIADRIADTLQGSNSTWNGYYVRGSFEGEGGPWKRLARNMTVSNCGYARFLTNGEVEFELSDRSGTGGLFVLPLAVPYDSRVPGSNPIAGVNPRKLDWISSSGSWITVSQLDQQGATAIFNSGDPSVSAKAHTSTEFPLNQGFELDLSFLGTGVGSQHPPQFIFQFGKDLRLVLVQDAPPCIERLSIETATETGTTGSQTASREAWNIWQVMKGTKPFDARGGKYKCTFQQIGGRLVWKWNDAAKWFVDADERQTETERKNNPRLATPQWGGVPLQVQADYLKARVEMTVLSQKNANGSKRTGTVTRQVNRASTTEQQGQLLMPLAGGHLPGGTKMPVSVTHTADHFLYAVTLETDDEGKQTPLLTQISIVYEAQWQPGTGTGLDVSAALTSATVTLGTPPQQAGAEGKLELDGLLLQRFCPGWENVLKDDCPVEISARWHREDGTITPWKGLMRGYLHGIASNHPDYNEVKLQFTVRDPTVRLCEPAAIVDNNCYPLETAFFRRMATLAAQPSGQISDYVHVVDENGHPMGSRPLTEREQSFYGGEGVQEILKMFLGPNVAATLNGNGDPLRFFPANHPPLLDFYDATQSWLVLAEIVSNSLSVGNLRAQNSMLFPPPYEEDAFSWISKFSKDEFAVFFYGYIDRDTDEWPVPIYGNWETYLGRLEKGNPIARLWSFDELLGNPDDLLLILSTQTETRPENVYNRVLVLSNALGDDNLPIPAGIMGEARIADGPNSEQENWRKTLVLKTNYAVNAGTATALAATVLAELDGDIVQFPEIRLVGDSRLLVGDVVYINSNSLVGIDDLYLRIGKVTHEFRQEGQSATSWVSDVVLQTMSRAQKATFFRTHNMPIPSG